MDFKPSAGEIANLWNYIIANQAHLCLLEHWAYHAEDKDLKLILQRAKDEANRIVVEGLELYQKAGFPKPKGYSLENDVEPQAPKIMSDKLIFFVMQILSEYGVYGYGLTLGKTETPEVLSFVRECLNNAVELYSSITALIIEKGYQHQEVYIPVPKQAEYVQSHQFLAGWWGEQRHVSALEIDNLIFSLRGVILAKMMFMMFSQIARDPKVKKYVVRGKELTSKRVEKLQSLNTTENLPFQATYETEMSDSTISPFSDRLIMFESLSLTQIAIARYGNALSLMMRRDLSTLFALYIAETGTFLDDGLNLMIENGWFEQPPLR